MDAVFEELKKYIPEEVLINLPVKKYHKGDFLYTRKDPNIYILLRGVVRGVCYQDNNEVYYPFLYKPGDPIGFLYKMKPYNKNWEVVVVSKKAEAIVFTPNVINDFIMNDLKAFKFFTLRAFDSEERGKTSFFLRIHGGAEAMFAYGLISNEEGGKVVFESYTNVAKGLGISRSMLYKIINKFVDAGLIQKGKNNVIIKDRDGLIKIYSKYIY